MHSTIMVLVQLKLFKYPYGEKCQLEWLSVCLFDKNSGNFICE